MSGSELEPWEALAFLAVAIVIGIRTWWAFGEGRASMPPFHFERDKNPIGFWITQLFGIVFVVSAIVMVIAYFLGAR